MKKAFYLTVILLLTLNVSYSQPASGSVVDIESEDELPSIGIRYYYYPNLDAYFDTQTNLYIYELKGVWTKSENLVSGLRGYSLMNTMRFPIENYNGSKPYTKLEEHRKQFPKKYTSKRVPPKVFKNQETATK